MNKTKQDLKNTTREQALDLGRHYLQTRGFNAFSFQLIADELGIRKASLHYHFASKEDMGIALIEDYENSYKKAIEKMTNLNASEKLAQMFQNFCKMSQDQKKVCPLGVLAVDFNTLPKGMQDRILRFHKFQKNWLIDVLAEGVRQKLFKKDLDLKTTADLIITTIQGGLQMARLRGESTSFKALGKRVLDDLKA